MNKYGLRILRLKLSLFLHDLNSIGLISTHDIIYNVYHTCFVRLHEIIWSLVVLARIKCPLYYYIFVSIYASKILNKPSQHKKPSICYWKTHQNHLNNLDGNLFNVHFSKLFGRVEICSFQSHFYYKSNCFDRNFTLRTFNLYRLI